MSKFTGYKLVEYEASPGSFGGSQVSLGVPLADSPGFTPEIQETENSKGQMLYSGNKKTSEWHVSDLTKFSALDTIMKADTEVDVRVTYMDDSTEVIQLNTLVKVSKPYQPAVGSRNYINVKFANFTT